MNIPTAEQLKSQVRIRHATEGDVPFIFNSWLKTLRKAPAKFKIENPIFFESEHLKIEGLLTKSSVVIACSIDDPTQIFSYMCYEEVDGVLVVHMAYTKEPYRKLGMLNALLTHVGWRPAVACCYTNRTKHTDIFDASEKYRVVYHPYLADYGFEAGKRKHTYAKQRAEAEELES